MRPDAEAVIIDALYRSICDESELQRAVTGVSEHFHCPSLLLEDLDLERPERSLLVCAGEMDAGQVRRFAALAHLDPAAALLARLPLVTAGLTYRVFDPAALRRTAFVPTEVQIAAVLGLSTVRTQLKEAFRRTGTHSQADLVRLTLATLGDLMPSQEELGAMPDGPPGSGGG